MSEDSSKAPSAKEFVKDINDGELPAAIADIDFSKVFNYRPEDVDYLLKRRPYFQLLNVDASFEEFTAVELIELPTGWKMHYMVDALSASTGEFLFGGSSDPFAESAEELIGNITNPGKGTVINQAFLSAVAAVQYIQKEWAGIHIIAGDETSQFAVWVAASELNIPVIGYEPTDPEAADKRRRILKRNKHVVETIHTQTLKRG